MSIPFLQITEAWTQVQTVAGTLLSQEDLAQLNHQHTPHTPLEVFSNTGHNLVPASGVGMEHRTMKSRRKSHGKHFSC